MNTTPSEKKILYIIDIFGLIFRAYYALSSAGIKTVDGIPTGAVFGVIRMLNKFIKTYTPEYMVISYDSAVPTERKKKYPNYKANRDEMPSSFHQQIPILKDILNAMNIPSIERPGYESDDIIATLVAHCKQNGIETRILTKDKDLFQLVDDNTFVIGESGKDKDKTFSLLGAADAAEKLGVPPEQVVDLLGLMGDTSDNIPGVKGIGPKTAQSLLRQFGSMQNIYHNLDKVKSDSVREKLERDKDAAELSYALARLHNDLPIDFSMDTYKVRDINSAKTAALMQKYNFTRLLKDMALTPEPDTSLEVHYTLVSNIEQLNTMLEEINTAKICAFDVETDGLDVLTASLVGMSFSTAAGTGYYVPLGHMNMFSRNELDPVAALQKIKPLLESEDIHKVGQNIKFDYQVCKTQGIQLNGIVFDTMLAAYCINPQGSHSMDNLAQRYLGYTTIKYTDVVGKGKTQKTFAEISPDDAVQYAAEDADITWRLYEYFNKKITEQKLTGILRDIDIPVMRILAEMEYYGVLLNRKYLAQLDEEVAADLKKIEQQVYTEAGVVFNLKSPKQLGEVLFTTMKIPHGRRTKTGFSTNAAVLEGLAEQYPIAKRILEFRSLSKLRDGYIVALPKLINTKTGRVHTSFHQAVTLTGRLSSSDPNLQNIPVREGIGRKIRESFIAPDGSVIVSADYSQIELRLLAHISDDHNLKEAFLHDMDIHTKTACEITGCSIHEITPEIRRMAKIINFGIVYGMTRFGLSKALHISDTAAQNYIDTYFARYPGIKKYMNTIQEHVMQNGWVENLFGRRRYFPDLSALNVNERNNQLRQAGNTPIQGTGADLLKKAMIQIDRRFREKHIQSRMIIQVHDELVFEVPKDELDTVMPIITYEMEHAYELSVPLKVDIGYGQTWAQAH